MTSPLTVSSLPKGYKWVDIVYAMVNTSGFTLKLMKYQVGVHLLTEGPVSGRSCTELQSVQVRRGVRRHSVRITV